MPRAAVTASAKKHRRAKPGAKGGGRFFHIEVRPKTAFEKFRVQDVGGAGGIERLAGQRASGAWATVKWLVGKQHAHLDGARLVPDSAEARKLFSQLGAAPVHLEGDRFRAKDRVNVPEEDKPTPAQKRARTGNIKKAQAAVAKRRRARVPASSGRD